MSLNILDLPNEVLLKIFSFLSPLDLIRMSKINDRVAALTCSKEILRNVNFKKSRVMSKNELQSFFNEERSRNIINLDIDDCFNVMTNNFWVGCFIKCANLRSLCIQNIRFTVESLKLILCHLPYLEDLSWSLMFNPVQIEKNRRDLIKYINLGELDLSKLRRLSLYFLERSTSYMLVNDILYHSANLESLHLQPFLINDPDYTTFEYRHLKLSKLHSFSMKREFNVYTRVVTKDYRNTSTAIFITNFLLEHTHIKWKKLLLSSDIIKDLVKNNLDVLTALVKNVFLPYEEINNHHLYANRQCNSLSLQDTNVMEELFQLNNENIQHLIMDKISSHYKIEMIERLKNLVFSSQNITELNLLSCHFSINDKVLKTISYLKGLKSLSMQSCAVLSQSEGEVEESDIPSKRRRLDFYGINESLLQPLVNNCTNILELTINGCVNEEGSIISDKCCHNTTELHIIENDLNVIPEFKNLQSLILRNLPYFGYGHFMFLMTSSCRNFKKLLLHKVGNQKACDYNLSLSTFLKNTSSLVDITLYHKRMDLNSDMFWSSLAKVKTLERICIKTEVRQLINTEKILVLFNQIPKLCVFHIHAPIINSSSLFNDLNRISKNKYQSRMSLELSQTSHLYYYMTNNLQVKTNNRHLRELCLESVVKNIY